MLVGAVVAVLVYKLLRLVMRVFGRRFAAWYRTMDERFVARLNDHRIWMLGVGLASLVLTMGLFASTPAQFFPNANSDFSVIGIEMVPGTTLQQTEAVTDRVAKIVQADPNVATAFERVREGNGRIFINLKRDREATRYPRRPRHLPGHAGRRRWRRTQPADFDHALGQQHRGAGEDRGEAG